MAKAKLHILKCIFSQKSVHSGKLLSLCCKNMPSQKRLVYLFESNIWKGISIPSKKLFVSKYSFATNYPMKGISIPSKKLFVSKYSFATNYPI